jgi:hypothetical protein
MFSWLKRTRAFPVTFFSPMVIGGLLLLYCALMYGPLIWQGGIIVDDWGDLGQNLGCGTFLDCYLSWFPLFANRPLAPIALVLSTLAFGMHFWAYLAFNAVVFLSGVSVLAVVVNRVLGTLPALGFFLLASVPIIAMPIVASPINCLVNNSSFLFWALALLSLSQYCKTQRILFYFASYLALLVSLLTYELVLPLVVLMAMLPYVMMPQGAIKSIWQYALRFIVPLCLVIVLILCWQKIIAPVIFSLVYSRLEFSWEKTFWGLDGWLSIFYPQLPNLFKKLSTLAGLQIGLISIGVLAIFLALLQVMRSSYQTNWRLPHSRFVLFIIGMVCVACYVLFALGGAQEVKIGTYGARILSSTWIAFALLLAALVGSTFGVIRVFFIACLIGLTVLSATAFSVSRDRYIASWQLQQVIISDVLKLTQERSIKEPIAVLGDVPQYLPNSFNQEIVFSAPWDFGFALRIYSHGQITGGAVIDSARGLFHDLKLLEDGILLDGFWRASPPHLWLYRFDSKTQKGSLAPLSTPSQLRAELLALGYLGELGRSSTIELGQIIDFGKPWVGRHQFIDSGWFSESESWGGIWSAQSNAQLVLPMPTAPAKTITFVANALVAPNHPQQRVEVSLGGQLQTSVTLTQAKDNRFTITIPQSLQQDKTITIHLRFLDAASPQSLGMNADTRTLAFGLKQIRFD